MPPEEKREDVLDIQLCHVDSLLHQVLDRLEILEGRTVSLEEYRKALRCPHCGSEMAVVEIREESP